MDMHDASQIYTSIPQFHTFILAITTIKIKRYSIFDGAEFACLDKTRVFPRPYEAWNHYRRSIYAISWSVFFKRRVLTVASLTIHFFILTIMILSKSETHIPQILHSQYTI